MRLLHAIGLLTLTFTLGVDARAADRDNPPPTIWRLNDTGNIGGHAATVLGAPRVVDEAGSKTMYFNGTSDGLLLPVNPLEGLSQFTIEVLFNPANDGGEEQRFLHIQDTGNNRALLEIRLKGGQWALDTFLLSEKTGERRALLDSTRLHPANRWTWVALVYRKGHMAHFIDGVKELEGDINLTPMGPGQISLGVRQNKVFWFKGGIREVRFHSTALDAVTLQKQTDKP